MIQWRPRFTLKNVTTGMIAIAAAFAIAFSVVVPNQVTTFLGAVREAPEKQPAQLRITPSGSNVERFMTFPVDIVLTRGDMAPRQVAAQLRFDPTLLQVVYVQSSDDVLPLSQDLAATFDNSQGIITIAGSARVTVDPELLVATVYLRALESIATTQLSLSTGDGGSFITAQNAQGNVLGSVVPATVNIVLQAP